jgi:hypothetical protein
LPVGIVLAGRRVCRVAVGGERVCDRYRVGLRHDLQVLPVADHTAQLRERLLDPRQLPRAGGHRVRDPVALDDPHIPPVGGDDQAVRLDRRHRNDIGQRPDAGSAPAHPATPRSSCPAPSGSLRRARSAR